MKFNKRFVCVAGAVVFATAVLAGTNSVKAVSIPDDKIADGVYIGSVNVSGMTKAEAEAALDEYVATLMDTQFVLQGPDGSMKVTAEDMGVYVDTKQAAERAMTVAHSGNLINRYKEYKDLESSDLVLDMNLQVDKQLTANLIYDKASVLNKEAVNNGLELNNGTFTFVEGHSGQEVDIVSSVVYINDYLANQWDGENNTIDLISVEVLPKGTREELAQVQDELGTFTTNFSTSGASRSQNVINGCNKINGTVVYPGEEFSVYEAVSPFSQENGYELAGSYLNGTTVESFGGGICQVSSTLYNAVIRAELEVTMRYNHSMLVSYVEPSDDAAIAGTYKDFRFVNNYDFPIYIQGYCSGKNITFTIYGKETRASNRTVTFESEIISQDPPTIQFNYTEEQLLGYWKVEQGAHLGTVARLWKVVKVDGVEQSREPFNKSTYQASPRIITIGIAGATPEQIAALNAAVATNDEATVQATVASMAIPVTQ